MRFRRFWASLFGLGMVLVSSGGGVPCALAQGSGVAETGPTHEGAGVAFAHGRLSVDVQDADFSAVFRDIVSQARIEVSNLDSLAGRRISVRFTGLPVVEGLRRLLRVARVPGYVLITAHMNGRVKIRRILFLDGNVAAAAGPRVAAEPRAGVRRARLRARARTLEGKGGASTSVFEELKAYRETERLRNHVVHPNEGVREQAIEGLMRLAGDTNRQRDLIDILTPYLDDLRHGDEETRREAREDLRSLLAW